MARKEPADGSIALSAGELSKLIEWYLGKHQARGWQFRWMIAADKPAIAIGGRRGPHSIIVVCERWESETMLAIENMIAAAEAE